MAFRNPIRHLPASGIVGQIPGSQISGSVGSATSVTGPVDGSQITAGTLGASAYGVGSVGYQALSIGTGNLLPDPSFEGAYAQTLTSSGWTIDPTGNASAKSLRVTTTVASGTRGKTLATIPVIPNERYYLAVDYKTSSDWTGSFVKLYLQYLDGSGAVVGFGVAQDAPVPGATWKRISTLTSAVPPNAVTAKIIVEHNGTSILGSTWWDNAEVRTAVVAGAIAAGIITAGMLSADAVDGKTITGATLQTAASGNRVVVKSSVRNGQTVGEMDFFTEVATDSPGQVSAYGPADGTLRALQGTAPVAAGGPVAPWWKLSYESDGSGTRFDVGADTTYVNKAQAQSVNTVGNVNVGGMFSAANVVWGTVQITPVANTLTSFTVTGLNLPAAGSYRVLLTANSANPDQLLAPLGYSSATSDGFTIWLKRSNTTPTFVTYAVLAK